MGLDGRYIRCLIDGGIRLVQTQTQEVVEVEVGGRSQVQCMHR